MEKTEPRVVMPPLGSGELLSSWLARGALRTGVSAHTFGRRLVGDEALWTRDIDCTVSAQLLQRMAEETGIAPERLRAATLLPERSAMASGSAITPWLLALGIFHRKRKRHGLQYCPHCLLESGHFRRDWRFAFSVWCETHHRALLDQCVSCATPVAPHRAWGDVTRCWKCTRSLTAAASSLTPVIPPERAISLQRVLAEHMRVVVRVNDVGGADASAAAREALQQWRRVVAVAARRLSRLRADPVGQLELADASARWRLLTHAHELYEAGCRPKPELRGVRAETRPNSIDPLASLRKRSRSDAATAWPDYARERAAVILNAALEP